MKRRHPTTIVNGALVTYIFSVTLQQNWVNDRKPHCGMAQ